MKKISDYLSLPYEVVLVPEGDRYFVRIKELDGCMSYGDTVSEAYQMIEEAKVSWIEAALEDGVEIPLPEAMKEKPSGKFVVRIPSSLHAKLINRAKHESVSLNSLVTSLLSEQYSILESKRANYPNLCVEDCGDLIFKIDEQIQSDQYQKTTPDRYCLNSQDVGNVSYAKFKKGA